ncbi:MAG: hypothetical protein AAFP19_13470 [Bacteroidota bacterium]
MHKEVAAIEALNKKGLKMQDTPAKTEGEISKKFGNLYDKTGGNPTNKQVEKWPKTRDKRGNS